MKHRRKFKDTRIRTEIRRINGIEYTYDLVMRESDRVASYGIPLYTIQVEMTQADGSTTAAKASELFDDAGRAIDFFEKLVDNLATPIDLAYVVEDELAR